MGAAPGSPGVSRPRSDSRPAWSLLEHRAAELACVGVMVLWAANFVVVKTTIPVLTPVGYAFLRFALAGIVLLAICRWREGSIGIPRREIVPLAGLGLIGFGIYQMLWSTALDSTSVGNSALLIGATPVFTALVASALGVDTLTWIKALGAGVAFIGVGVIAAGHGLRLDSAAIGDLMTLIAAFSWASYVTIGAGVLRRFSALRATAWTVTFGALFLAPVGLWQLAGIDPAQVGPVQIGAIAYSGLLSSALGNVVVFWGISLLGPTRITNLQFLPPALAIVFAAIFLGDPILASQVVGGLVIVAGSSSPDATGAPADRAWSGRRRMSGVRRVASPAPYRRSCPVQLPIALLIDYDGTIAMTDVSDTVMAEHAPGSVGRARRRVRRRSDGLAPPHGVGGRAHAGRSRAVVRDGRSPAPRPGLRAVRPAGAGGRHPGRGRVRRLRLLHRPGAGAARPGRDPGRDRRDVVGWCRPADDRLAERPPDMLRVRDLQARPGARPSGRRSGGGLHRRWRVRPVRGRLRGRHLRQAIRSSGCARRPAGRSIDGDPSRRSKRGWPTRSRPGARIRRRRCCPAPPTTRTSAAPRSGATAGSTRPLEASCPA